MAAPSEAFKWTLFPGARRYCWRCERGPLRVKDVAEHRRKFPGGKDEFLCVACKRADVEKMIADNRRALGLQGTPPRSRS